MAPSQEDTFLCGVLFIEHNVMERRKGEMSSFATWARIKKYIMSEFSSKKEEVGGHSLWRRKILSDRFFSSLKFREKQYCGGQNDVNWNNTQWILPNNFFPCFKRIQKVVNFQQNYLSLFKPIFTYQM